MLCIKTGYLTGTRLHRKTEGVEAFDKLKSNVTLLQDNGVTVSWANEITQDLKAGKRYLKTDYKTHTSSEERCKDHYTIFSLSDPNNNEYSKSGDHKHDLSCHECARLACVCDAIAIKIDKNNCLTEEQRVRAWYNHNKLQNLFICGSK